MNIFLLGDIRFRYLRQIIAVLTAFHIKLTIIGPFTFVSYQSFKQPDWYLFFSFSKIQNLHKLHQSFQIRQIIFNSLNIYLFITSHIYVTFTYLYKIVIFLLHSLKEINLKPNARCVLTFHVAPPSSINPFSPGRGHCLVSPGSPESVDFPEPGSARHVRGSLAKY